MTKTPYTILEVAETASAEVIKAAWHSLQRKYHPDRATSAEDARLRTERCKEINAAYSIVSDPVKRLALDTELRGMRRPVEMPRPWAATATDFDPTAYPDPYASMNGSGQAFEFGAGVFDQALKAAGNAFVGSMFGGLPPEVREIVAKLMRDKKAKSA